MIRKLKPADVGALKKLLNKIETFNDNEVDVAMELINIASTNPEQEDYNIYIFENDGRILGYHCTGRRPLTDGVYDLYWIVADPDADIKGIGRSLLEHAENFVRANNGRWFLAETSSKESYTKTRNFYLRNNFSIISQINDFYTVGDHLMIFGKYLK